MFSMYQKYRLGEAIFVTSSNALCREVYYSVSISEGPLSEVPLHTHSNKNYQRLVQAVLALLCTPQCWSRGRTENNTTSMLVFVITQLLRKVEREEHEPLQPHSLPSPSDVYGQVCMISIIHHIILLSTVRVVISRYHSVGGMIA